ncbi:hypothetical protein AB0J38_37205 [Streptomyces sp. NPDC050095]|uniref:hypothetical protein n=1 Tax=unclassified Streptomyces TaxID=2593676 RepID=UPI00342F4B98
MKIAKAAAGIAGIALALGAASPALADAPVVSGGSDELLNSNTVTKTTAKNPLHSLNAKVVIDAVSKAADKLATKNDLASKTNALQGAQVGR